MTKLIGCLVLVVLVAGALYVYGARVNLYGRHRDAGVIEGARVPASVIASRTAAQIRSTETMGENAPKQILFGDLHVHTTFSTDAFLWSLPIYGGEGAHPLADACDFARYCSAMDFWSINDHAEASTPARWQETKESIRQCNARAGDPANPDMVVFMGFEWSQVGRTPATHYGHKNVIFAGLDDKDISVRPIAAAGPASATIRKSATRLDWRVSLADFAHRQEYYDFRTFADEIRAVPDCDPDLPSNLLPANCYEQARTPGDLVTRLDAQKLKYLLIPHGTTWGFYTPPGTTWDKQLKADIHPEKQTLIEVKSGHGNSEEYRPWRAVEVVDEKKLIFKCPRPSDNYLPSCWQAGEIIRKRCREAGESVAECDARAAKTRSQYASLSVAGHTIIAGEEVSDWLDSGQCRDCFMPAFNYRPGESVQYGLAISNFDKGKDQPVRFDWGFVAASDNHRARPGTGYKAYGRRINTEANGPVSEKWRQKMFPPQEKSAKPLPVTRKSIWDHPSYNLLELERQSSFFSTGGLTAVHAGGRSRKAIWDALKRKETYATSGHRILLWFDLIDEKGATHPMGSHINAAHAPHFRVRAAGSYRQKPGCPDFAAQGLPAGRLNKLCRGECYNPSEERLKITRIEVVKITPQTHQGEDVNTLIHDTWKILPCTDRGQGCTVEFDDPGFVEAGRDALYYVRAIEEPTPTINGANLRCIFDDNGKCVSVNPCYGDYRTPKSDNCLADVENRAWSSPIYLTAGTTALKRAALVQ